MASFPGKTPEGREQVAKSPLPMKPPAAAAELIDLAEEARQLRTQPAWDEHGQSAKTLVKHEHFRVVLVAVKAGRRCKEHSAEESMSAHAVEGAVRADLEAGDAIELRAGSVLAFEPGICHDFEALEDSTVLLTLAWTGHRAGH
jgi:quercetin dioxygenase-like cupin family protein